MQIGDMWAETHKKNLRAHARGYYFGSKFDTANIQSNLPPGTSTSGPAPLFRGPDWARLFCEIGPMIGPARSMR